MVGDEPDSAFVFLTPSGRRPVSATDRAAEAFRTLSFGRIRDLLGDVIDAPTYDPAARGAAAGRTYLQTLQIQFPQSQPVQIDARLRERLEKARLDPAATDQVRGRAGAALETIERAQISTIHALCAAILGERPLECGVVPGFRTADEAEAELLFAEAWDESAGKGRRE